MKTFFNILYGTLMLVCMTGCQKILDENVISQVTAEHYKTVAGYEDLVRACYPPLRDWYGQELGFTLTEYGVDTYTEAADGNRKYYNRYEPTLDPRSSDLSSMWREFYRGINTANTAIGRADAVEGMNAALKARRVGEARFLRALYYFLLVQTFGDVHLTLEETRGVKTEINRTAAATIYKDVILPDLLYAVENLPATQADYGRITQPAAKAILMRVYLVLKDWDKAATLAKSVIGDYNFKLMDTYGDIWKMGNQRNSEVVWAVQFTNDPLLNNPGNRAHLFFLMVYDNKPGMERDIENGRPFRRYKLTPYGNKLFDTQKDQRYRDGFKRVFYCNTLRNAPKGMQIGDTAIYVTAETVSPQVKAKKLYKIYDFKDITTSGTEFLTPVKFLDPLRADRQSTSGSRDFFVVRIAEAYLTAAEALWRQGNIAEAVEYINALRRKRAIKGFEQQMEISQNELNLDFILDERGRELYGEMQRWFDLKRTGTLLERVKKYNLQAAPNIQEYHLVRPIPQDNIDRASNKVEQNPGYN